MGKLDGKVAAITGGARGQGRSHALTLAREGADVAVCDIDEQLASVPYPLASRGDLAETARLVKEAGRECLAMQADVRSGDQMRAFADACVAQFGRVDIVVGNAGILSLAPSTWDLTDQQWQEMIDVNLTGVWQTCKAFIPPMISAGLGGSVVLTSSIAGLKGVAGCTHYTAAKHGVVGLMRTLAWELAPHRIRVNTIHPTGVDSPMSNNDFFVRWLEQNPVLADAMRGNLIDIDALPAQEISNALLWLVSDEARYVTGVALPVDAGFMIK